MNKRNIWYYVLAIAKNIKWMEVFDKHKEGRFQIKEIFNYTNIVELLADLMDDGKLNKSNK